MYASDIVDKIFLCMSCICVDVCWIKKDLNLELEALFLVQLIHNYIHPKHPPIIVYLVERDIIL